MGKIIPLCVPNFIGNEEKYVLDAVKQQWVSTGGEYVNRFEENMAKFLNVRKAAACQSGTSGIHLALILCNVGANDEVIVPALTFIAAVNPVKYVGASPVFMDCDDYLTIDTAKMRKFCENNCDFRRGRLINKKTRAHIKAVIAVHVFGEMCNMEDLINIAEKYNLKVIEDATEALGSRYRSGKYKNKYAGTIGDFGVYSFNGNKIITTGGGGMIVARDEKMIERAKYLSTQAKDDALYYIHDNIGYNYRMTNLQAALGTAQLENIKDFIMKKRYNYKLYKKKIADIDGLTLLKNREDVYSNCWFYSLMIDKDKYGLSRDEVIRELKKNKIGSRPIWSLINNQEPYKNCEAYKIEKAEDYLEKVVNIPCSTNLEDNDVKHVVEILEEIGRKEKVQYNKANISHKKILAVIPARGGSKGIPGKNIKDLNGRPLIAYTIEAAKKSRYFDKVVVSTDEEKIAETARKYGAEIPVLRPHNLAEDNSKTIDAVLNMLEYLLKTQSYNPEYVALLQPTSPLRTAAHIDEAIEKLLASASTFDGLISVCESEVNPYWTNVIKDEKLTYFLEEGRAIIRRQDLPKVYRYNGAIYLAKTEILKKEKTFEVPNLTAYIMDQKSSIDIDTVIDFQMAEILMKDKEKEV